MNFSDCFTEKFELREHQTKQRLNNSVDYLQSARYAAEKSQIIVNERLIRLTTAKHNYSIFLIDPTQSLQFIFQYASACDLWPNGKHDQPNDRRCDSGGHSISHSDVSPPTDRFSYVVHKGEILSSHATLAECNVIDGSVLFLVTEQDLPVIDDLQRQEESFERLTSEFQEVYGVSPDGADDDDLLGVVDRIVDLTLNQCEGSRKGLLEMTRMYEEISAQQELNYPVEPTVIPEKSLAPSEDPIPMFFLDTETETEAPYEQTGPDFPSVMPLGQASTDSMVSVDDVQL